MAGRSSYVLVVDDDAGVRDVIVEILRSEGYRAEEARDGREALAVMERAPPCLLLLDLMMPAMNGWQVIDELRARPAGVAVCILTASPSQAPAGLPLLSKPVELDQLLTLVSKHYPPQ